MIPIIALHCVDGEFVPLVHIESINSGKNAIDEDQLIVNILKDDKYIRITTFSGHRYHCSMLEILGILEKEYSGVENLPKTAEECYYSLVFPAWVNSLKGSKK